jgi:hypothetical protein
VAGSCEHHSEPSGFVTGEEILEQMNDYLLLMKHIAPWG